MKGGSVMQTMITMKYNEKSNMPSMYAERYGIIYKEIRREFINILIDECVTDRITVLLIEDMLSKILRAEPVDCYVTNDELPEPPSLSPACFSFS